MADTDVNLHISLPALQAKPLRRLQRLIDIVRFNQAGAGLVGADHYPVRSFITLNPSQNTELPLDEARMAARDWLVLHALRDAVEAISLFLEDVRMLAAVYTVASKGLIQGAEWNAIFTQGQKFHRLRLPDKVQEVRVAYEVESDFDEHVLSLNRARNCLVHRDGVVSAIDADPTGELEVTFAEISLLATHTDGSTTVVTEPRAFEAGTTMGIQIGPRKKSFRIGEPVSFSYDELQFAVFSHQQYAITMTTSLQRYAEVSVSLSSRNLLRPNQRMQRTRARFRCGSRRALY